ncbi:hypothetical protein FRB91_009257 [Serendipita sp. 411]|nr:hypothetical protein FRB91_009257 [Serendipita sp. 411]
MSYSHGLARSLISSTPIELRMLLNEQIVARRFIHHLGNHDGQQIRKPFHQIRRGHNLSTRFKELEANIRSASVYENVTPEEVYGDIGLDGVVLQPSQVPTPLAHEESNIEMEEMNLGGSKSILRPKPRLFQGVLIPIKPSPPASDDCCMSSCTVCVYDLYATALEEYEEALSNARSELTAKGVASSEWPIDVLAEKDRAKRLEETQRQESEGGVDVGRRLGVTGDSERERQMAVIIGAFVKFEQSLREKRKTEKAHNTEGA